MKIMANQTIRRFFIEILGCAVGLGVVELGLLQLTKIPIGLTVLICQLSMILTILLLCYGYFKKQNRTIESAITEITDYISGNTDARIDCNQEGELFRLFHEVNTLVSILNAHVEKEQEAKNFMKDTIGDISHQLKTPLAALSIYNEILQSEIQNPEAVEKFAALSQQELERMDVLVQTLLKITRMDAGTIIFELQRENVSEIMEHVQNHFAFRAQQEEKVIRLSGDTSITFLCDRNWLTEALDNILKNALDHTKPGDWVHIEWKQSPEILQIRIEDNGCGIHAEDLYHIFKRFYRSQFSKEVQGIGLGLPLAKSIIEGHRGTIKVESEWGEGTVFIIEFLIPTEL